MYKIFKGTVLVFSSKLHTRTIMSITHTKLKGTIFYIKSPKRLSNKFIVKDRYSKFQGTFEIVILCVEGGTDEVALIDINPSWLVSWSTLSIFVNQTFSLKSDDVVVLSFYNTHGHDPSTKLHGKKVKRY